MKTPDLTQTWQNRLGRGTEWGPSGDYLCFPCLTWQRQRLLEAVCWAQVCCVACGQERLSQAPRAEDGAL